MRRRAPVLRLWAPPTVRRALEMLPIAERAAITLMLATSNEPIQPVAPHESDVVAQGRRGPAALTSGVA